MPIAFEEKRGTNIVHVRLIGKLARNDYAMFVPEVERMITVHGKVRMLVEMRDFRGWDMAALWKDIKFDAQHFKDIERLAMVGDQRWQKWMTDFCRPFTTAEIRYFELSELDQAQEWISDAMTETHNPEDAKRSIKISVPQ